MKLCKIFKEYSAFKKETKAVFIRTNLLCTNFCHRRCHCIWYKDLF